MAIGKISGAMLQTNLDRQGQDLTFDGNLIQLDVTNRRVGINTVTPTQELDVVGNAHISSLSIVGNTITSDTGKIGLGSANNVVITGGTSYDVLYTDGNGNLFFGNLNILSGLDGFTGNNISLGTNTNGNLSNAVVLSEFTTVTDAIALLNQLLGNITDSTGSTIHVTGNISGDYIIGNISSPTIDAINANILAANLAISALDANVGAYEIYANTSIETITTNLGNLETNVNEFETYANIQFNAIDEFELYANANIGSIYNHLNTLDANVGDFQIYANANIGTITTTLLDLQANVGAFEIDSIANAAAQSIAIDSLATGANANTAAYLTTYSGNITAGNITSTFYGNVYTDYISGQTGNVVVINGTGALQVPVGDTAQRPVGINGYLRYNTDTPSLEYFDGAVWVPVTNTVTDQIITGDGVNDTFTLDQEATTVGTIVSINGTLQQPNLAYTISGNQITFAETPLVTDVIDIRFLGASVTLNATLSDDLTVSGNITLSGILSAPQQTKASTAPGEVGQVCWDSNYIYVCTAPNTWKRTPLTGGY